MMDAEKALEKEDKKSEDKRGNEIERDSCVMTPAAHLLTFSQPDNFSPAICSIRRQASVCPQRNAPVVFGGWGWGVKQKKKRTQPPLLGQMNLLK